jgi:hypothetical protein
VGALLDNFSAATPTPRAAPGLLPDEALLIKAEALATRGSSPPRRPRSTRCAPTAPAAAARRPQGVPRPAQRAARQADLLAEIYTQRRFELFGTGLRWEDARRRSAIRGPTSAPAVPFEGQRCWLPYAVGDRNANPNATRTALPDPAEPAAYPSGCPLQ